MMNLSETELLRHVGELLRAGHRVEFKVSGHSMRPFLFPDRDLVILERPGALRKGHIVLAKTADHGYVMHRIIGIADGQITLKGDANWYQHEHCAKADVLGMVTEIHHSGRILDPYSFTQMLKLRAWNGIGMLRRAFKRNP